MPEEFTPTQKAIAKKVWGKKVTTATNSDKENVIYTSYLETDRYILEQVVAPTHPTHPTLTSDTNFSEFIQYDKATGEFERVESFQSPELGQVTYSPIEDDLLKTGTIMLPTGVEEYGETSLLVKEISSFLSEYFEPPKFFDKFFPYLILFYWTYDYFPFVPYLQFVGRTGTGKTTAMEVFGSICYKPIDASGSITMSPIFRTASKWRGTLLLDEFSATGDNYKEMISFLKSGVANRAILRTEGDKVRDVKAYMIKCPKIFTSEDPISDAGLQSRTIVVKMRKNTRKVPLYRLKRYTEQAARLRNKLLLWRLRNLGKISLEDIEYGFEEFANYDGRVQQVISPIYYFSDAEAKADILEFAKEQEAETLRERREAVAGQIFQLIMDYAPIEVSLKFITTELNKERHGKMEYSEKKVGNIVRKILGLEIKRIGQDNVSTVIFDGEKLNELAKYYGVTPLEISVESVGSVVGAITSPNHLDTSKNEKNECVGEEPEQEYLDIDIDEETQVTY